MLIFTLVAASLCSVYCAFYYAKQTKELEATIFFKEAVISALKKHVKTLELSKYTSINREVSLATQEKYNSEGVKPKKRKYVKKKVSVE